MRGSSTGGFAVFGGRLESKGLPSPEVSTFLSVGFKGDPVFDLGGLSNSLVSGFLNIGLKGVILPAFSGVPNCVVSIFLNLGP